MSNRLTYLQPEIIFHSDEVIDEKTFFANCILASAFLSIPLAEAAFTTSTTAAPGLSTLLLLGGGERQSGRCSVSAILNKF